MTNQPLIDATHRGMTGLAGPTDPCRKGPTFGALPMSHRPSLFVLFLFSCRRLSGRPSSPVCPPTSVSSFQLSRLATGQWFFHPFFLSSCLGITAKIVTTSVPPRSLQPPPTPSSLLTASRGKHPDGDARSRIVVLDHLPRGGPDMTTIPHPPAAASSVSLFFRS